MFQQTVHQFSAVANNISSQLKNRCKTCAGGAFRSSKVRKSIILKFRSSAGGLQILAPKVR